MNSEDELRRRVGGLAAAAGGQRPLGRRLGVDQSAVSRYLAGGRLTLGVARGLHREYPELRALVEARMFAAQGMRNDDGDAASDAAPERGMEVFAAT